MTHFKMTLWMVVLFACGGGSRVMAYDTIVIGLGSAGCTAASTLALAGKSVLALEAQDWVGGRVHTVPFGDGVVELGAEWIHGTVKNRVYDTAIENNVDVINQTLDYYEYYMSNGSLGDRQLLNALTNFALQAMDDPPPVPEPLGQFISRRVIDHIKEKYPHLANDTDFIDSFLHCLDLDVDNLEGSNSWNDVTTMSKFEYLEGHQYASWHRHGYKTFFEIMLNTYKNGPGYPNLDIQLNKEVSLISWPQDPAQDVTVSCTDGTVYKARNVIVTVSLGVLKERHNTLFAQPLPSEKLTAIEKMSIGVVGKIILTFPQPWWPSDEWCTLYWIKSEMDKLAPTDAWLSAVPGLSRPTGCGNCFTFWTIGDATKLVETLPDDVVKTKAMELLRRFMGKNITIPEPTAMLRSNWHNNPYTRGTYTYENLLTPQYPNARVDLAKPLVDSAGNPRVLFAGEATSPKHFSTVHGASETGYREAMRLLSVPSKI